MASDTENDSEAEIIEEEDPPSPGPSVPNGKFFILLETFTFINIITL